MTTDTARISYADRERNAATREAMSLIRHGVAVRRLHGVDHGWTAIAASQLHRSVATQARYLGLDTAGWMRP